MTKKEQTEQENLTAPPNPVLKAFYKLISLCKG